MATRTQAAQQIQIFNTKLEREAVTPDPLSDFTATWDDNDKALPKGNIVVRNDFKGKRTMTKTMLKNFSGSGITDPTVAQVGNEISFSTREWKGYSGELRQAVDSEQYGFYANDWMDYGVLERMQPNLSLWLSEMKGKYAREALWQKYSTNLTGTPHSLTQGYNENILVKNVALSFAADQQPDYTVASAAAYLEDIGDALTTAGTTDAAKWDVEYLVSIEYWAKQRKIKPLKNGRYAVLVPSRAAKNLKDPTATDSIAEMYKDSNIEELARMGYKSYLGTYGMLDLYEDIRAPVTQLGGSDGSWTLTNYYKGAGDDDDRTNATGTYFDVGFLLGENALHFNEFDRPRFVFEENDYGRIRGVGIYAGCAYQRNMWVDDLASETRASTMNQSSMALLTYAGSFTA